MTDYTIIAAIKSLGGISPDKIRRCGTWTEWSELPGRLRSQIFRKTSTTGPDDMAGQLEEFGIYSENDLLNVLKDPDKLSLLPDQVKVWDEMVAELERLRRENEAMREKLQEVLGDEFNPDELEKESKLRKDFARQGGFARSCKLSAERRSEIARNAARARYARAASLQADCPF